jgi:hypothetical protein
MGNIRLDSGGQKVHFGRVEGLMTKVRSLPSFYGGIIGRAPNASFRTRRLCQSRTQELGETNRSVDRIQNSLWLIVRWAHQAEDDR